MQQISIDPKVVAGNTGPDGTNNTCAAIPENRLTRRSVLGPRLICFQIGNEPEYYKNDNTRLRGPDWDFAKYLAEWTSFAQSVIRRVPEARFGGPDVGSSTDWVIQFAERAPKLMRYSTHG